MRIIRADGSVIEGTPEEIAEFESRTRIDSATSKGMELVGMSANAEMSAAEVPDWEFVSLDVAFRALTRIRLGKGMRDALKLIHASGNGWTYADDLQEKIGYEPSRFAGLMGAFGRRLVNTPGYVLHSSFFEQEFDEGRGCYRYRLPPSVRAAVEKARVAN